MKIRCFYLVCSSLDYYSVFTEGGYSQDMFCIHRFAFIYGMLCSSSAPSAPPFMAVVDLCGPQEVTATIQPAFTELSHSSQSTSTSPLPSRRHGSSCTTSRRRRTAPQANLQKSVTAWPLQVFAEFRTAECPAKRPSRHRER